MCARVTQHASFNLLLAVFETSECPWTHHICATLIFLSFDIIMFHDVSLTIIIVFVERNVCGVWYLKSRDLNLDKQILQI